MRATALVLVLASVASAEEPQAWGIDAPLARDGGPRLPGAEHASGVVLWLPMEGRAKTERGVPHMDHLFHAAAIFDLPEPTCVIELYGTLPTAKEQQLRWEEATLLVDGKEVACTKQGLRDRAAGRSARQEKDRTVAHYVLSFPALAPEAAELVLTVPVAEAGPLQVKLFRWKERMAKAEAALAAWRAHVAQPAVQAASATGAWTECQGKTDLLACGEPAAVPILLRELSRAGKDGAIPHFALLHVLSGTAWGKSERIPEAGTPEDAARIVQRWKETNVPHAPGVTAPR